MRLGASCEMPLSIHPRTLQMSERKPRVDLLVDRHPHWGGLASPFVCDQQIYRARLWSWHQLRRCRRKLHLRALSFPLAEKEQWESCTPLLCPPHPILESKALPDRHRSLLVELAVGLGMKLVHSVTTQEHRHPQAQRRFPCWILRIAFLLVSFWRTD